MVTYYHFLILNSQFSIFYLPTSHLTTKKLRTDRKYLLTGAFLISFLVSSSLPPPIPARHTNLHRIYVSKVPLRTYTPGHPLSAPKRQRPYKHPNDDSSPLYKARNRLYGWGKDDRKQVYKSLSYLLGTLSLWHNNNSLSRHSK